MAHITTRLHVTRTIPTGPGVLAQIGARLAAWFQQAATRRQLADLDDRALSDIGIGRAQAQFLAERPVWELIPFLHR